MLPTSFQMQMLEAVYDNTFEQFKRQGRNNEQLSRDGRALKDLNLASFVWDESGEIFSEKIFPEGKKLVEEKRKTNRIFRVEGLSNEFFLTLKDARIRADELAQLGGDLSDIIFEIDETDHIVGSHPRRLP